MFVCHRLREIDNHTSGLKVASLLFRQVARCFLTSVYYRKILDQSVEEKLLELKSRLEDPNRMKPAKSQGLVHPRYMGPSG